MIIKWIIHKIKSGPPLKVWRERLFLLLMVEAVVLVLSNEAVAGLPVISWVLAGLNAVVNFLLGLVGLYPTPLWLEEFLSNPVTAFLLGCWWLPVPLLILWTYVHEYLRKPRPAADVSKWASGVLLHRTWQANHYHDQMKAQCRDAFTGETVVRLQDFHTNEDRLYTWDERGEIRIEGIASGPIVLVLRSGQASVNTVYGLIPLERNVPHLVKRDKRGDVVLSRCAITWIGGSV